VRQYLLDLPAEEARYSRAEWACDACGGAFIVAGVVKPGKDGRKSYPIPIAGLEARGGWPCSCADVAAGVRV
jgi:hypothetical protein